MKSSTKTMTLAIAAVAMAAGTVSAQTMKAEIPFAFRVGKQIMQPGEYRVHVLPNRSGVPILALANRETNQSALVVSAYRNAPSKAWAAAGNAKLSFTCGAGPCTLTRAWSGEGDAFNFPHTLAKDGEMRTAEITLRPDRAD